MYRQPSFVLQKHSPNFRAHYPISYRFSVSIPSFLYLWFSFYTFGTTSEYVMEKKTRCQSRKVVFFTNQYFEMPIKEGEGD